MSHFTVLVVGENPENQLSPFDENLKVEFDDHTERFKTEYETESTKEFYCQSHSSWGMQITKDLYDILRSSNVGTKLEYKVTKIDPMSYFKLGQKYKGHHVLKGNKRCKGSQWFEVVRISNSPHPNPETCFEGDIIVRKIKPPKETPIKKKYPKYEDYLTDWHGCEDHENQGWWTNPKAKWDWYKLGGRWCDFFKLKPNTTGENGERSWPLKKVAPKPRHADQAMKKDIDFDGMLDDNFEENSKTYDLYEQGIKELDGEPMDGATAYFEYGIQNTNHDTDEYVPETRVEFLKRLGGFSVFAILKDGEWYEKGEMGWWAMVNNEKAPDEWKNEISELIDILPEDTLLSLYDCHI